MACIRYGLQQTTKDSDWIVAAVELVKLRGLFERCERRLPPWVVQYRPIFGAPFEAAWLDGGWSSRIFIRTMGGGPDHHRDFFCHPREPLRGGMILKNQTLPIATRSPG